MIERIGVVALILFAASILMLAGYGLVEFAQPPYGTSVQAKAADPAIPDCVAIGKSGPLVVSRCEDEETNTIIYVNNYGMMVVAP